MEFLKVYTYIYFVVPSAVISLSFKSEIKMNYSNGVMDNNLTKIIGGYKAKLGDFPYQVSLQKIHKKGRNYCGGSIISSKSVLTAAHCVTYENSTLKMYAVAGEISLESKDAIYHEIQSYIIHPDYKFVENDIAIAKIEDEFTFDNYVNSIKPASSQPKLPSKCIASGWGAIDPDAEIFPNNLMKVDMVLHPPKVCSSGNKFYNSEMHLCAGGERGKGTCFGDSGGPLVCDSVLYGITMGGGELCGLRGVVFFTNVYNYYDWITQNM